MNYQNTTQDALPEDYFKVSLDILDDRLKGEIEDFYGFTISMDVPEEFLNNEFSYEDLIDLVGKEEINGGLHYPSSISSVHAGETTEIIYEVVNHRHVNDIYMKTTLGYFLWEYVNVQNNKVSFAINWWYHPPASEIDLEILRMAKQLLINPSTWHQHDDRKCDKDISSNKWSLFCALKNASIEKMGDYNHHNTAIQTVRFVIDDLIPNHGFEHTLMDYNNAPSTTHKDILKVLDVAMERIKNEIEN